MDRQKPGKLQILLQSWPSGAVATTRWLKGLGISRQLINVYKSSDWLRTLKPGAGAYYKPQDKIECFGGLHALQFQLGLNIHVGGKTALELQGLAHNISVGYHTIDLLKAPNTSIPQWFSQHKWKERLRIIENSALPNKIEIEELSMGNFNIQVSSRERAVLELLCLTPRLYSFEETQMILLSLGTLRADVLTKLLSLCTSERAKRLLLYFGEYQNHAWHSKIDKRKIKIGNTLLKITSQNGKYDSKYNLFLPRTYVIENGTDTQF